MAIRPKYKSKKFSLYVSSEWDETEATSILAWEI